jgi:hypothetical protein
MAEEQKPVVTEPAAPATEATPAESKLPEPTFAEPTKAVEPTEGAAAETPAAATSEEPSKAAEEPVKEAAKDAEPVYKGTLKYVTGPAFK